ncbi:hypothetical protein D8B26_004142 [Coccidioides posadasii str. Silveira]|uniref:Uncharacterized protein n=1 Tax=Coccidioides posadasii (strain RMSCC 757 / Silveira) TaxID=443226 RepID=E9DK13_COCPS|nr:conserved hypothetical protein [Coccidioides posadasii str. Silveira]QVM09481.1 hypothetical protein D8B26_004142 [Coccidioides posadasii str. Silveira]
MPSKAIKGVGDREVGQMRSRDWEEGTYAKCSWSLEHRCTTATEWKYCQETASRKERWSDAHSDALQRRPLVVSAPTDSTRRSQDAKGLEDWRCTTTASSSARRYNKVIAKHKAKQTTLSADWPGRN